MSKRVYISGQMSGLPREEYLARFREDGKGYLVGFAVMGGIYAEGIDLAGDRLIGAVVVGISSSDVDDIYIIRTRIEGLAARRAAQNITEEELSDLREIVELQEFYLGRGDSLQVGALDQRFHEIVYESCRSRPLKQMLTTFHNYIQKARVTTVRQGRAAASTQEHRAILTAIEQQDADEAERLMGIHVENARKSFFELMG